MNYRDLLQKMKRLPNLEPLTMSSIPGYSGSHSSRVNAEPGEESKHVAPKRKPNKIEQARDKLVDWILDCISPTRSILPCR